MNFSAQLNDISIFKTVASCAQKLDLESYVVGGYVRDLVLKRSSKDIDFVCVGSGIALATEVSKALNSAKLSVFKNFGTAMVKHKDWELEFVGARKESYRKDSRKPIVEDGTLEDDQNRRDFTINAMAISLQAHNYGAVIDPFNGLKDLKRKTIRTPLDPSITFSDDPLRMMRAVRFASQLMFDIEPNTFEGIVENCERMSIVSMERVSTELNKIILSRTPSYGFKLLFHSGLLHQFFPEMIALHGVETIDGKSHKDNFYHTLQVLDNVAEKSDDLWLRWAAILHDIAKPPTKRFDKKVGWTFHGHEDKGARMVPGIFRKLKLPLNEKMNYVKKLVRLHLRPIALVKDNITDTAIRRLLFEAGDDVNDLLALCRADVTSKNHHKVKKYLANFKKVEKKLKQVEEKDRVRNFQPPISGDEIINTFNLKPSRVVGEIKEQIKEAILEGVIRNNEEEARAYMLKIAKQKGLEKEVQN
ncbi:HD domain-containing protein [Fulvivirga sp. RKSG066]|uniref:CCA tRNA nucleotidyltransferase n=1 Tax=Fulvivirga aurantia TaxID=2529383 RepID=UPI0012BD4194|nr:HD domain-containing protein [Fulvivirga aurantia]MTI22573.1 HD domain-containing protein [Fulvivirga aurantia]